MTTIHDIAKQAGVSVTTVSKALNGYPDVSMTTRENVKRITKELGYQPSARGFVPRRTMTIGVFSPDHVYHCFRNPFLNDVIANFTESVSLAGYELLFFSDVKRSDEATGFVTRAKHRDVDGVFLIGVSRADRELEALVRSELPVVSIDFDLRGTHASSLYSDNVGGARKAMYHLIENGHRKIAFIGDQQNTKPGYDRLQGYRQVISEMCLELRSDWIVDGDFSEISGYEGMAQLLSAVDRPTAVFCVSDMNAIGAIRCLSDSGLRVTEDISIIGFDDIELARHVTPGLTTIRQNAVQMGQMAAKELLGLMNMKNKSSGTLTVETTLVRRGTVRNINEIGV